MDVQIELWKRCCTCKQELPITNFGRASGRFDGYKPDCKECRRKGYFKHHKERRAQMNKYRELNIEKIREAKREYYIKNREATKERVKKYAKENRDKIREYNKRPERIARYKAYQKKLKQIKKSTPEGRIELRLRRYVRKALKQQGVSKTAKTFELLGCTSKELIDYLLSIAPEGMTLEHLMNGDLVHIDHIIPCCSKMLSEPENQRKIFHYTNLRPLWKIDNLRKSTEDKKLSIRKFSTVSENPLSV